jgi:asparagine synthase (glutamine-hydrolysing)
MCGIAGIVSNKKKDNLENMINGMLETIVHRGPDGSGKKFFDDKVALGHRRLAIIDLSEKGLQPMEWNKRYWITFNGEIYNYKELREQLIKEKNFSFESETDTEVILAAFAAWGEKCVNYFNGMWSFVIFDRNNQKMFCSRDRYGVKPFYYSMVDDYFVFGSEIKEILKISKGLIKANQKNLEAFLVNGLLDTNNETMFEGIFQLEGGCNLWLDNKTLNYKIERWHHIEKIKSNSFGKKKNCEIFRKKLFLAIRLRLRSDVPIGSCLSGGLDSSAIVCIANSILKEEKDNVEQYTITSCFTDEKYDEQKYADAVTEKTGTISYKIYPDIDKFFKEIDKIVWHMDEPFISMSMFAQWNIFREAKRKGLKVMLDGQGADEQLAGYTSFYNALFYDLLKKGKVKRLFREIKGFKRIRAESEKMSTVERVFSLIARFMIPGSLLYKIRLRYNDKKTELPFAKRMYFNDVIMSKNKLCDGKNQQRFVYGNMYTGMRALLHYEDRDSMAHSIEARVPFLDADLSEFIYSIPLEEKIEDGKTKDILREALKDVLPESIYRRYSKLGFVTPQDAWINENKEFFYSELEKGCERLKTLIDKKRILNWYKNNIGKDSAAVGNIAFRIICAAHWADVFNVKV